jgi:CRP-like cAMP-binding protein
MHILKADFVFSSSLARHDRLVWRRHPLRIATTTAMEECVITSITKEAMIAALHSEPKFSELFMAYLLTRNSRVEEDLIDQLFNSSEKRLARLLLLAHFGKEGRPQPILLDMSQETLAEMIGTTRSRVSYFMNKFRKLGLISYNGKIHELERYMRCKDCSQVRRYAYKRSHLVATADPKDFRE